MRIAVDGYNLALPKATGVATYGRSFIGAARRSGHAVDLVLGETAGASHSGAPAKWRGAVARRARRLIDFAIAPFGYAPKSIALDDVPLLPGVALPDHDGLFNRPRLFRAAKGAFNRGGFLSPVILPGVDVAHWTYPLPIYARGARNIYTIHDLVPLKFPDAVNDDTDRFRRLCQKIVARADLILTVSECSRADISSMLDVPDEKLVNIYQPYGDDIAAFQAGAWPATVLARYPDIVAKGYFIFFGAIEPKKNLGRLLEAYQASLATTPLVVVAGPGWQCEEERATLRQMEAAPLPGQRTILFDYLSRADLLSLIHGARATLFPSLYEGFGLPALESMALGTAVIASNAGALPEVVGDAGLSVDPYRVETIRDAIIALDSRPSLCRELEDRGIERSKYFSPAAYQTRLDSVLRQLA